MDYDLIVVKTLERVYKNYYYIIRGEEDGQRTKKFVADIYRIDYSNIRCSETVGRFGNK